MSLLDEARTIVRVCSDKTDAEIRLYIDAAVADMRRVGVREHLLGEEDMTPLAKMAVMLYVEANYGHDNSKEFPIWWERYLQTVTCLVNSSANECDVLADPVPEEPTEPEAPTEPDDGGDEP